MSQQDLKVSEIYMMYIAVNQERIIQELINF